MKGETKLSRLPWAEPPQIELEPQTAYEYTACGGKKKVYYRKNYLYRCDTHGDVLILTFYSGEREPIYRSFTANGRCRAQYYGKDKLSDCTVGSLLCGKGIHCYSSTSGFYECKVETDERSRENVNRWLVENNKKCLASSETPILAVKRVQYGIRESAVKARNDRIRKSTDDRMLEIRALPKRFDKWIDKAVLKESRYIVYTYSSKKEKDGWCTWCNSEIKTAEAKHGGYGTCPSCRSRVRFIARGKMPTAFQDDEICSYIQPGRDGKPIFRCFNVRRYYEQRNDGKYYINTYVFETHRKFYDITYEWGDFRQTGEMRFCPVGRGSSLPDGHIYPYNMKKVFESAAPGNPHVKYIPYVPLLKAVSAEPDKLFSRACEYPVVEYLAKLKLYALCRRLIKYPPAPNGIFNPYGGSLKKVFPRGISRAELRLFAELDITLEELELWYEYAPVFGAKKTVEAIRAKRRGEITARAFNILKYCSVERAVRYAEAVIKAENTTRQSWCQLKAPYLMSDWSDYVEDAEVLGWDLHDSFILFPRNFREAHDRAAELMEADNAKALDGAVQSREQEINALYGTEGGKYLIRAPHSAREIVLEGQKLHHCVGTYAERVAKGKTCILFMRAASQPDKPLYTIEVQNGKLMQVRGQRNCDIKEKSEKAFFAQWKAAKITKAKRKAV